MPRRLIPDIVSDQSLASVDVNATVRTATQLMADRGIGAVLVLEHEELIAIFSERDVAFKVVAHGLDPDTVRMSDVATLHPQTIGADATPRQALRIMQQAGFRHLPIMGENGKVLAIVSMRDLYRSLTRSLEDDLLNMAHHMLGG